MLRKSHYRLYFLPGNDQSVPCTFCFTFTNLRGGFGNFVFIFHLISCRANWVERLKHQARQRYRIWVVLNVTNYTRLMHFIIAPLSAGGCLGAFILNGFLRVSFQLRCLAVLQEKNQKKTSVFVVLIGVLRSDPLLKQDLHQREANTQHSGGHAEFLWEARLT